MYEEFIAQRLAMLRSQKKVSAREMSLAIGQNESYINRIENKIAQPSMQSFFFICEYLGITPAEFFDELNDYPVDLHEVILVLRELNEEQLKLVKTVAEGLKNSGK
ncbi:MAG: helix-turn-helix domain-containing protein [Oscillospiraceae bacterium]|nr:helix-turn-helix domain-containing protein [Oscillospiraceae bacterium]